MIIELKNGFILLNGKKYKELNVEEKDYFNQYLIAVKLGANPKLTN